MKKKSIEIGLIFYQSERFEIIFFSIEMTFFMNKV